MIRVSKIAHASYETPDLDNRPSITPRFWG